MNRTPGSARLRSIVQMAGLILMNANYVRAATCLAIKRPA
jgi:hypothetical protein